RSIEDSASAFTRRDALLRVHGHAEACPSTDLAKPGLSGCAAGRHRVALAFRAQLSGAAPNRKRRRAFSHRLADLSRGAFRRFFIAQTKFTAIPSPGILS